MRVRWEQVGRRDGFVARIAAGEGIPPLIVLGPVDHLVDGYARYRALVASGISSAAVLRGVRSDA